MEPAPKDFAIHEAGHAVVACVLKIELEKHGYLTIPAEPGARGVAETKDCFPRDQPDDPEAVLHWASLMLCLYLAGRAANLHDLKGQAVPDYVDDMASKDLLDVAGLMRFLPERDASRIRTEQEQRAAELVAEKWHVITKLADELLARPLVRTMPNCVAYRTIQMALASGPPPSSDRTCKRT